MKNGGTTDRSARCDGPGPNIAVGYHSADATTTGSYVVPMGQPRPPAIVYQKRKTPR